MSVKDENGQIYESVALDCSYADKHFHSELLQEKIATEVHAADGNNDRLQTGLFTENDKNTSSNNASSERNYVLLILAGLTGGSGEGYVVDLVNTANKQGEKQYVLTFFYRELNLLVL